MGLSAVLVDVETDQRYAIYHGTPAWVASMEWAKFHGLDPMSIPAGEEIVRDARNCSIRFASYARDETGRIKIVDDEPVIGSVVEQGEAPPLPFPSEVTALCDEEKP